LKRRGLLRTHRAHDPQRRLPPPLVDEPNMPGRLAQVFVPEGHERYATLVTWTETAEAKWWKFGKSSDNRRGLWVPYGVWSSDPALMSNIGGLAAKVARDVRPSEAAE